MNLGSVAQAGDDVSLNAITTGQDDNYTGAASDYYQDYEEFTKVRLYVKRPGDKLTTAGTYTANYRNYWMRDQVDVATFDGSSYMEIPYTPILNTPEFTVSLWVNLSNNSGTQVIVDSLKISGSPQTYYGYDIHQVNGILYTRVFNGSNSVTDTQVGELLSNNTWYHIVMAYQGVEKKSYVNGVLKLTESETIALNDSIPLTLGNQNFNSTFTFKGNLHDLRYYNRALTPGEIKKIVNTAELLGDEVITMPMSTVNPTNLITKSKIYPSLSNGVVNNGVTTTSVKLPQNMVRRKPFVYKDSQQTIEVDEWLKDFSLRGQNPDCRRNRAQ